ncbi:uncharacterized protein [Anabrus simplex]|uniref:uncharacterized protein n=1 Tax=Anabrus simplex TaxID=316456 RepID=UPI0035A36834
MHRVAEELREKSSSVNSVISSVKKIFIKAPSRVRDFKTMHPKLPLPPEPILTRWRTSILAALYCSENHRAIEEVINTFDEADSKYIAKAKAAFKMKGLMPSLTFIKAYMSIIPEAILKLESRGMELVEVVATRHHPRRQLVAWRDWENRETKVGVRASSKSRLECSVGLGEDAAWRVCTIRGLSEVLCTRSRIIQVFTSRVS